MRRALLKIFVIAWTLSLTTGLPAQSDDWLSFYPSVVRLKGTLIKVSKYGKPTYGENLEKDEKVEVAILILQQPVRVKAREGSSVNNQSLTNISFVQMIFPPEMRDVSKHVDREIVVAGTLARGHRGDHFTEVVMTVKAVNPTGKPLP